MKETEAKEEQCKQHALSMIQLNKTGQKMLEEEKKKLFSALVEYLASRDNDI